jgi:TatD DNase family protein
MWIDSHAHLTTGAFSDEEVGLLLDRAAQAGLEAVVNICTDIPSLEKGLLLAKQYPWVYLTAATTPHDVEKDGEAAFDTIAASARAGDLVAVGESGLDYYYAHSPKEIQKRFLVRYLQLATECSLPMVIHCREAFADFFSIIDAEYCVNGRHLPGVLHCFTGTLDEAKQVLDRGWYLSLSGIITFKKSEQLREVAKMVPLDQLLIETDAPYLAPQSHRGRTNEPAFVIETAATIASVKGIPLEEVAAPTSANAKKLFSLQRL